MRKSFDLFSFWSDGPLPLASADEISTLPTTLISNLSVNGEVRQKANNAQPYRRRSPEMIAMASSGHDALSG